MRTQRRNRSAQGKPFPDFESGVFAVLKSDGGLQEPQQVLKHPRFEREGIAAGSRRDDDPIRLRYAHRSSTWRTVTWRWTYTLRIGNIAVFAHQQVSDSDGRQFRSAQPKLHKFVRESAAVHEVVPGGAWGRAPSYQRPGRQEERRWSRPTMGQLKNCCLGDYVVVFDPLLTPSIYLNQLSLSRDINYPIISDQINIFTWIFHFCATDNDSLRARMMCSYYSYCYPLR